MMEKLKALYSLMKDLVSLRFFGTVIIKMQDGEITHLEKRESIKL